MYHLSILGLLLQPKGLTLRKVSHYIKRQRYAEYYLVWHQGIIFVPSITIVAKGMVTQDKIMIKICLFTIRHFVLQVQPWICNELLHNYFCYITFYYRVKTILSNRFFRKHVINLSCCRHVKQLYLIWCIYFKIDKEKSKYYNCITSILYFVYNLKS